MASTTPSLTHGPNAAVPPWPDRSLFSPIPDSGPVQAAKGTWRRAVKSLQTGFAHVTGLNAFVLVDWESHCKRFFYFAFLAMQLLRPSGRSRNDNRVQEISEITQGLKALAKELNVPVLAISQLSRAVENREDKRPQLSDLRESGAIEQDADVVMFLYREEYYHERKEPEADTSEHAEWREKGEKIHGVAELIIGKQRHGPTGTIRLQFTREYTKFNNLSTTGTDGNKAF